MWRAFVCEATGALAGRMLDMVPVESATWSKYLSAGAPEGSVTVILDGTHTAAQIDSLFQRHWSRIIVLEYNGRAVYGGYIAGDKYNLAKNKLTLAVTDLWGLLADRGAWDGMASPLAKWKLTQTLTLAGHAAAALIRARDTQPADPPPEIPVTIPGQGAGTVKRTWFGYHYQTVGEIWSLLMDEGLDIYLRPRWATTDYQFDWLFLAAPDWDSGVTHEFSATSDEPEITDLEQDRDGRRITTSAYRVGEGSEQDMLIRSNRELGGVYPRRDRVTASKSVSDAAQLAAMADTDLKVYARATNQWQFKVPVSSGIDVGDLVRIHVHGDPVIPDGFHVRRVVAIEGDWSHFMTVKVQPTGGA